MDKRVEIYFVEGGSSADAWWASIDAAPLFLLHALLSFRPLHFVRIFVGNQVGRKWMTRCILDFAIQSVTNVLTLKQHIDPKPNAFIAEQLSATLTEQEYILFNVPMGDDVYKGS